MNIKIKLWIMCYGRLGLQIFLKLTCMLLQHLNYMMLYFGKTFTHSFWEIFTQMDFVFWTCAELF